MKNYIKKLKVNNQESNVSVYDFLELNWELTNCNYQISYFISVENNGNIVYQTEEIVSESIRHEINIDLLPESFYTATLKVKTDKGCCEKSVEFHTALVNGFSDKAKWITCDNEITPLIGGSPAIYLRKYFEINEIGDYFAYVGGLGLYTFYINGQKVGDGVLNLPFTNYDKRIYYGVYNVKNYLKQGKNEIVVVLGDGWYNQNTFDTWKFFTATFKDNSKLIFQMTTDVETICSDTTWDCSYDGPIFRSALRLGEFHDLNKTPSFKDKAQLAKIPLGKLVPLYQHYICETQTFTEYKVIEETENSFTISFPKNMAGYVSFSAIGKKGDEVTVLLGDTLKGTEIDNVSNSMYIKNDEQRPYFQTDKLILKDGENFFKPQFVFHGFQHAKFTFSSGVKISDITANFIHLDYDTISSVKTSSSRINRFQSMCDYANRSCSVGIFTDCPHREKNGWTGDLQVATDQMLFNYDIENDFEAFFEKICDCQLEDGKIPCIVPTTPNIFGYAWGSGPVWDVALFMLANKLGKLRNSYKFSKKYLTVLENYLVYAKSRECEDGLLEFGLGDWNIPRDIKIKDTPLKLLASLYYQFMCETTGFLNEKFNGNDKGYYKKAQEIKDTILKTFVSDNGKVATGSICSQAAILYFNLVDGKLYKKVFNRLLKELEKVNYNFHFGLMGARYLFDVLSINGRQDIVFKMLSLNTYPSFGYWIKKCNAVTMFEDYEFLNSRNHYMYGNISAVFYKYFAGIDYHFENDKQYVDITIPNVPQLNSASANVKTPNGIIKTAWKKSDGKIKINIKLPPNVHTVITLPNGDKYTTDLAKTLKFTV